MKRSLLCPFCRSFPFSSSSSRASSSFPSSPSSRTSSTSSISSSTPQESSADLSKSLNSAANTADQHHSLISPRRTYRHILRGIQSSTHGSKAAYKNLTRLLRRDFEDALCRDEVNGDENGRKGVNGFEVRSLQTTLLLLSASYSPKYSTSQAETYAKTLLSHPSTFADFDTYKSGRELKAAKRDREKAEFKASAKREAGRISFETNVSPTLSPPVHPSSAAPSSPTRPSYTPTLAHKILQNLSSLTYHHLSPHTRMLPLHKTSGGTNPSTIPKLTTSKLKDSGIFLESEMRELSLIDAGESGNEMGKKRTIGDERGANLEHLPALIVPPKPIVGPKLPTGTYPMRWNGQKPVQSFSVPAPPIPPAFSSSLDTTSPGSMLGTDEIKRLQARLSELKQNYARLKELYPSFSPSPLPSQTKSKSTKRPRHAAPKPQDEINNTYTSLVSVRGKLKSARKAYAKQQAEREIESLPLQALLGLVRDAEKSTGGAWLGAKRFAMKVNGEWLPP